MTDSGAKKIAQVEPWMRTAAERCAKAIMQTGITLTGNTALGDLFEQIIAEVYAERAPGVAPPANYSTDLAPVYIAEQIFFHVFLHGGEGNPFRSIDNKWFVEIAAPKIRELLTPMPAAPKEGE